MEPGPTRSLETVILNKAQRDLAPVGSFDLLKLKTVFTKVCGVFQGPLGFWRIF